MSKLLDYLSTAQDALIKAYAILAKSADVESSSTPEIKTLDRCLQDVSLLVTAARIAETKMNNHEEAQHAGGEAAKDTER